MAIKDVFIIKGDNFIELQVTIKGDTIYFEIEDECCGDSETGFGAIVGIDLSKEQVKKLAYFMLKGISEIK